MTYLYVVLNSVVMARSMCLATLEISVLLIEVVTEKTLKKVQDSE
jgi:hypothetical protein